MVLFYRLIKEDILVKLRLTRIGRHKRPFYRLIAADARSKANGKFIEQLGHYDPISKVSKFDKESILKLLLNGAVPTETVKNLFSKEGI
jgi:small subunit ribosomal protein S16